MAKKSNLDIVLRLKDEMSGSLKKAKNNLSGLDGVLGGIGKGLKVGGIAIAGALAGAGYAAVTFAEKAGKFESVTDAFNGMGKEFGTSSSEIIKSVKEATRGTVTEMDILGGAVKAGALIGKDSMGNFGDTYTRMSTIAKKASRATGQDVSYMFDSIVTGVGRASPMILDNLGITLNATEVYDKFAKGLNKTAGELTMTEKKTAILNAVLEQGEEKFKDVSVSSGGYSGALQKATADMEDMKIKIGTTLLPAFNELVRSAQPFIDNILKYFEDNKEEIAQFFVDLKNKAVDFAKKVIELKDDLVKLKDKLIEYKDEMIIVAEVIMTLLLPALAFLSIKFGIDLVVSIASAIAKLVLFIWEGWKTIGMLIIKSIQLGIATAAFIWHTAVTIATTTATALLTVGTWLLNAAFAVLTSPIFLVIAAIVALIAIGVYLYKNWDYLKEGAKIAFKGIANFAIGMANSIRGAFESMVNSVISGVNNLIDKFNNISPFKISELGKVSFPDIPKLATGTNYVPRDTLAQLHEGEAVVPKKYNPQAGGIGGGLTIIINGEQHYHNEQSLDNLIDKVKESFSREQEKSNWNIA